MSAKCDKCGAAIHWVTLPNGNKIPLDVAAKVFEVTSSRDGAVKTEPAPQPTVGHLNELVNCRSYLASHYAVCKGRATESKREPSENASDDDAARAVDFIKRLDCAVELSLTEFEEKFVASTVERSRRYKDVRFSEKQMGVVEKLREKYESGLPSESSRTARERPAQRQERPAGKPSAPSKLVANPTESDIAASMPF